jgi:hypothetical protein
MQASYQHNAGVGGAALRKQSLRAVRQGRFASEPDAYLAMEAAAVHTSPPVAVGIPASMGMMIWTVVLIRVIVRVCTIGLDDYGRWCDHIS